MKHFMRKRVLTPLLVLALAACLSLPALAADPVLISMPLEEQTSIGLMIDGKLHENAALLAEGEVYLPFRLAFEALGATVTFDADSRTAKAVKGAVTVEYVLGATSLTVTRDGVSAALELDNGPAVNVNGSVYLPQTLALEAFGAQAAYDELDEVFVLVDVAGLLAQYKDSFTILGKLARLTPDFDVSLSTELEAELSLQSLDSADPFALETQVKAKGLASETAANAACQVTIDLSKLGDTLTQEDLAMLEAMGLEYPLAVVTVDVIVNMADGVVYATSPLFNGLMGAATGEIWITLKLADLLGTDYIALTDVTGGPDALLDTVLSTVGGSLYPAQYYEAFAATLAMMDSVVGDNAFEKKENTYTAAQTLDLDEDFSVDYSLAITVDDEDNATGCTLTLGNAKGADGEELTLSLTLDKSKLALSLAMKLDGVDLTFSMDGAFTPSEETPVAAPGEEAAVIDLLTLLSGLGGR